MNTNGTNTEAETETEITQKFYTHSDIQERVRQLCADYPGLRIGNYFPEFGHPDWDVPTILEEIRLRKNVKKMADVLRIITMDRGIQSFLYTYDPMVLKQAVDCFV